MDKDRIIEVGVILAWSNGKITEMSLFIPPGGRGRDFSSTNRPDVGGILRDLPPNDDRIGILFQNQSDAQLQLCFYHKDNDSASYTVFLFEGRGEEVQGASLLTATFRHTGRITVNGPENAMFALMDY